MIVRVREGEASSLFSILPCGVALVRVIYLTGLPPPHL